MSEGNIWSSTAYDLLPPNLRHSELVDGLSKQRCRFVHPERVLQPGRNYLATGAEDRRIRIWDVANRFIQNVFDRHTEGVYSIDFSRDGRLIISSSGDRTTHIWDVQDGSNRVLAEGDTETTDSVVSSVAFSPDGRLAAGSLDNTNNIYSVVFTPDGNWIVSGSLDKMLKYWDVGKLLANATKGDPRTSLPSG
ncbi:WD40-repeat-containing domain protein [Lactarius hengduanensis]|nr:WD40-repeat-containing domain protein [Lactarius hengduanensis]